MQIVLWYLICAHELFSIWLFQCKLALFVLVKFSSCQDENILPIFPVIKVEHQIRSLALSQRSYLVIVTRTTAFLEHFKGKIIEYFYNY